MATESDQDKCRVIVDAAMETAVSECGSKDAVRESLKDMFGFSSEYDEDPDCEQVVQGGVTDADVATINAERRFAMCRAWDLIETQELGFRQAINRAWMEIREAEDK